MALKNRRVYELRLGKLGLALFVGGMSCLLFCGFLLGIVVGKHMEAYPERYDSGIPELFRDRLLATAPGVGKSRPAVSDGEQEAPAAGEEQFDLTFYDTLGAKKGEAPGAGGSGSAPATPAETPAGGDAPGRETVKAGSPPGPDGKGSGPDKAVSAEAPSGAAAQPGKGRFEIQAAAYREQARAERMCEQLRPLGFSSRVVRKELPGRGTWFRVVLDGYPSRAAAREAAGRLAEQVRGVKCVIRPAGASAG